MRIGINQMIAENSFFKKYKGKKESKVKEEYLDIDDEDKVEEALFSDSDDHIGINNN